MSIISFVNKVIVREEYHPFFTYPAFLLRVHICRLRYQKTLKRLRAKIASRQKIKVLFLNMDISKWKCQSLYELMDKSDVFDPVIGLTITDEDENHTHSDIIERNRISRAFYVKLGDKVVEVCVPKTMSVSDPKDIGADIVFYQVPWGNLGPQKVYEVSRYALTCYMPYSIENYDDRDGIRRFDDRHMAHFHQLLWESYSWSDQFAEHLYSSQHPWEWAGKVLGLGHTIFDAYTSKFGPVKNGKHVIYAPHFRFSWGECPTRFSISTFDWSGKPVLEYAKQHPELNWVFKPHPKLRERVVEIGFMTKAEVDEYYHAWESIGRACYDGDYMPLFADSYAMITDCESFLYEYMATGSPLIHLVSKNSDQVPNLAAKNIFDSFYSCDNQPDMLSLFKMVLEEKEDPMKGERLDACKRSNLIGNDCAKRLLDHIMLEIK